MAVSERGAGAARWVVGIIVALMAVQMLAFGVWMLFRPDSFAEFVGFPPHNHFLHDLGAFHIGIGVALTMALFLRDAVLVTLGGFATACVVHTVNHVADSHMGGSPSDPYVIGIQTVLAVVGVAVRIGMLRNRPVVVGAR